MVNGLGCFQCIMNKIYTSWDMGIEIKNNNNNNKNVYIIKKISFDLILAANRI